MKKLIAAALLLLVSSNAAALGIQEYKQLQADEKGKNAETAALAELALNSYFQGMQETLAVAFSGRRIEIWSGLQICMPDGVKLTRQLLREATDQALADPRTATFGPEGKLPNISIANITLLGVYRMFPCTPSLE